MKKGKRILLMNTIQIINKVHRLKTKNNKVKIKYKTFTIDKKIDNESG